MQRIIIGVVGLLTAAIIYFSWPAPAPLPSQIVFHQVAAFHGTIISGRFAADGHIFYSASMDGAPVRVYSATGPLSDERTLLASVAPSGRLAMLRNVRPLFGQHWRGDLFVTRPGSAPFDVMQRVEEADWDPSAEDEDRMAVVQTASERRLLEYPAGRSVYDTPGWIGNPRVSPREAVVAFADLPDPRSNRGSIAIVGPWGFKRNLSTNWAEISGLAWRADGTEVWFAAKGPGSPPAIYAVTQFGKLRTVLSGSGRLQLLDVATNGRLLVARLPGLFTIDGVR